MSKENTRTGAKTIFITGSSSGIGRATSLLFAERGWNVVATMRNPHKRKTGLEGKENIQIIHLDVTDDPSIKDAVGLALQKNRTIDVLLNNAGYAVMGAFEASSPGQIQRQFDTNVFGLMAVTREVLPVFREQGYGVIINVASVGGRIGFPFYSLYNSTKFAVEGFSEALRWELEDHNIKVKIIEPGIIRTDFYDRSMDVTVKEGLTAYDDLIQHFMNRVGQGGEKGSPPEVIAHLIFKAANDKGRRLRYHAGAGAGLALGLKKILPETMFHDITRSYAIGKKKQK